MANRVGVIFTGLAKQFFRSTGSVFWTVAFPVMLILIFGAIFSGGGSANYSIYVQDHDGSPASEQFIQSLNSTGILTVNRVSADVDIDKFIEENSVTSFLVIPSGFNQSFAPPPTRAVSTLELRVDTTSGSSQAVMTAVSAVIQGTNLQLANGTAVLNMTQGSIVNKDLSFIDFFLPGTIGLMVMTLSVQSIVGYQTRYRNNGIFRKLATTPMSNVEWLMAMITWMLVMVAISVAAIMITGILLYNIKMTFDLISIAIIVVSTMLFTAMGIIISQFVKDEEVAGTAAGAITFPMMFLAGSFFPLENMPAYLQSIANLLPLTYVNNGLRDAMVYGNTAGAVENLLIIMAMTAVFVVITVAVSGWKKE